MAKNIDLPHALAHPTDIFALSATQSQIFSASGSSSIKIHSTIEPDFPLVQTLEKVHQLGCHHLTTSRNGQVAASVGFGGEVKIWRIQDQQWNESRKIVGASSLSTWPARERECEAYNIVDGNKAGEIWAVALSDDGQYLAATSFDGRINVWDNLADGRKIREFETKGSFGMSIDLVMLALAPSFLQMAYILSLLTEDSQLLGMRMAQSTSSTMTLDDCSTPCLVNERYDGR